ncbi:MAG: O-antigen/teichoic acid export membrane protein [Paracoccaceae bacterium]|jgi:O-antigen/teichoic acid export membrane protein
MGRLTTFTSSLSGRYLKPEDIVTAVARQGAGALVVRVSSLLILFGVQALLARLLGADQFGVYTVALAVMGVLQLFARQGFEIAASRFVGAYSGVDNWALLSGFVRASRILVLGGAILFSAALLVVANLVANTLGDGMLHSLWLIAAILPLFTVLQLEAAIVRGMGRASIADIPTWILQPLLLAAGVSTAVFLADAPARAPTVLSVFLGTAVCVVIVQHIIMIRVLPQTVLDATPEYRWGEWMKAAPAMMLFAGSAVLISQANTVLLGAMSSAAEAGIYNISGRIAGILQLVTFCFIGAIGPVAARLHAKGDMIELARVTSIGVRVVFAVALIASIILVIGGEHILAIFGEEFRQGYHTLLVLLIGQLFWAATVPAGVLLNMTGHHNESGKILIVAAAVNFGLCALLIPIYGSMGAAIATSVAIVLWNGIMAWSAERRVGIRAYLTFTRTTTARSL